MTAVTVTRRDVLRWRFSQQELHREPDTAGGPTEVALLDYGVQDTGTDGAAWALANRGGAPADAANLAFAWTIRGAPHAYRRSDIGAVAVATAPWSVRNHLRFYGPARARDVAEFLDAPLKEVRSRWPEDAVEVEVGDLPVGGRGGARFVLAGDLGSLTSTGPGRGGRVVRLLGSHDAYLQLRDREMLAPEAAHRKDLWRAIGRPGAIVADGEILGTWRPRASGRRLTVRIEPWAPITARDRALVEEQAERLAVHRGVTLAGLTLA